MLLALSREPRTQNAELLDVKLALFHPKLNWSIDLKNYTISTASTRRDLLDLIELRQHSFFSDFGMPLESDRLFDKHDLAADHVILRNRSTGQLLGSYRILNSSYVSKFYSQEQFELTDFLLNPGNKIELSRACIHKDHRNGITLNLIWRGLAAYAQEAKARYLFGCSSVKSLSPRLAKSMFWNLYPGHFESENNITVLNEFKVPSIDEVDDLLPFEAISEEIPPLLKSYLKAGAKICSEPALDRVFKCFDFLTVLDLEKMNDRHRQRFFGC